MFDITSSKLLLLGIVALIVIGPKDLPVLLRTIGKYIGIIRGHAKEFRAQFDEAMRETELSDLKKDVENIAQETEASLSDTKKSVEAGFDEARHGVEASVATTPAQTSDPLAHDADTTPAAASPPAPPQVAASGADGTSPAPEAAAVEAPAAGEAPAEEPSPTVAGTAPAPAPEKTGA
jgi:sec-independent protein translocase protein TatB